MIEKERLKELIEKGANIYWINKNTNTSNIIYLHEYMFVTEDRLYQYKLEFKFEDLYETKEDAEFALKYQNITRPETLSLLNYEDFVGLDEIITNWRTSFFTPEGMIVYLYITDDKKQIIVWRVEEDNEPVFEIENTKENYWKACEVARKLFLGEKVEEV